jgi:hypothetical protein
MKKNRLISQIFAIAIILILLVTAFPITDTLAAAGDKQEVHLPTIEQPLKGNPKLESVLNQLVDAGQTKGPTAITTFAEQRAIDLVDNRVKVVIEAMPGEVDAAREAAIALGAEVEASYENLMRVVVPVYALTDLVNNPSIRFVRQPRKPEPQVISEGVSLINADDWQSAGFNGSGVKVGILDMSFSGYASLLGTELPASVTTHWFISGGTEGTDVHGTACTEIIHDIAPAADLYLTNVDDEVTFCNAVDWLISQGVDVISCSLGWPIGGPGDGTGLICSKVSDARNAGILWVNSAGNLGQGHWMGSWVDTDSDNWLNFAGIYETNSISANYGDTIWVTLKWDDTWGLSSNNYNLYLYDSSLNLVDWSVSTQNGDDDPVESIRIYAPYTGTYHIAIRRYSADGAATFHLFSWYQAPEYRVVSNSLSQPADSPAAMTVGAVPWYSPAALESFSSQGPTDDGRIKPDLVGPDSVSTASYGPSYGSLDSLFGTGFSGTSASAPHAAGAAALVKQAHPSYTPAQIQAFLEGEAVDLGVPGKDNLYGAGRLNLQLPPTVAFSSATYSAAENAATKTITVNLSGASAQTVTVNYATSNGNATAGSDYTAASGTLTFNPGNTTKTFNITILDDAIFEGPETVNLALSSPVNATLGSPSTAVLTITDNETPPSVAFSSATYSAAENAGNATITVNLSGASVQTITVNYATSNGNATAGSDYTAASGMLTFNPGNTTKTFNITILDDAIFEGPETVNLALSSPGNATLGSPNTAVLTITDNEGVPSVAFSSATYSAAENAGNATITVSLSGASAQTITVNYATSNGNATAGSDYTAASGTLTFNPGNTTKTFNITILDDILVEGDETVNLALSSPVNATLGSPNTAVLTITDNETQPSVVSTNSATNITTNSATLNGNLIAMGTATSVTVSFEWGNTTSYGNETAPQVMTIPGVFSGNLTGLNPNTIYHFRAKAIGNGTSYGDDTAFTTAVPPMPTIRHLPGTPVSPGQTFDVTVTFTAPTDNFNAIGLVDNAPTGWAIQGNVSACTPNANFVNIVGSQVNYAWTASYNAGQTFTALYKVSVPGNATAGSFTFNGQLGYKIGGSSTIFEIIAGNSTVQVYPATPVTGITREVNGNILPGVSITLDGTGPVVSDQAGQFQIMATATGNHNVVAHKDKFRDRTQTINITGLGTGYAVTCNFQATHGLIPNAPDIWYALDCINLWLYPPNPDTGLDIWTALDVINAWLYPVQ